MKRREFLLTAGAAVGAAVGSQPLAGSGAEQPAAGESQPQRSQAVEFQCREGRITVQTDRYTAEFNGPRLVRFASRDGHAWLESATGPPPALELVDCNDRAQDIGASPHAKSEVVRLGPHSADVIVSDWHGDGVVRIEVDLPTGALCVTPSVTAARRGVARVRWNLAGLKPSLDLVAPFYQGVRLKLDDTLIARERWRWPSAWEAALAVLQQGDAGGMSVCCHDRRFRYKNLYVGHPSGAAAVLGLETENYGPWHDHQAAGGLTWRLDAHAGSWPAAAEPYRRWLWRAFELESARQARPAWFKEVTLAVSWCPSSPAVLEALAKRHPPGRTLLHVPGWRDRGYDEDYPRYVASEDGRAFLSRARTMGFRVMPHFNFFAVDPSNAAFAVVAPFVYRKLPSGELDGWGWKDGGYLGIPQSGSQMTTHREDKVMAYIHPGSSWWRSCLCRQVSAAAGDLELDSAFVDQTLCTWNTENCLVEDQTPTEGMWRLTRELSQLVGGLTIGGEGLNEISMQWQSFAQAHLFKSHHQTIAGLERVPCPVGDYLFGQLCRTIGYANLHGRDEQSALRMQVHAKLGTIPTITIGSADEIERPNEAVGAELARAAAMSS